MPGTAVARKNSKYCTPIIAPQGPGGLASGGRTPMILNAMQLSRQGLMQAIPLYESTRASQNIGIITGLTETTNPDGSTPVEEPKGCCDAFPVAGLLTMCEWAAAWGLFGRQSRVYSLCDDDDDTCDRPIDVVNAIMSAQGSSGRANERNFMNSALLKAKYELDATFKRDMAHQYFSGNPKSSQGVFRPFKGIASLINTGYRDAISGELCPRADSVVISAADYLGSDKVCKNASGFVHLITSLVRNSKHQAFEMGLGIIDGVFIGPSWMRDCIIDMWACGYGGCSCCGEEMKGAGVVIQQTTERTAQMRDDMMMESFILVDGMQVPWIVDDSDTYGDYDKATGERTGRLFYSPITVMNGSVPVFYQQFKPWNTQEMSTAMREWGGVDFQLPSNNPAWLLFKQTPQNLCLGIAGVTKRRLAHHAPFLAFQVTDITCCTFIGPNNMFPPGRTEGPLPYAASGIPGGEEMGEIDMSKPYCVTLKNEEGEPTPTTVYLQPNGCYVDESGCEIDLGDICPTEGACEVVFAATLHCYNPWDGESVEAWLQEDGTYNTAEDGSGDEVDVAAGTLCEGACPIAFAPVLYCVNPHGAPPFEAWLQEDGTYNTAEDGSGDPVDVAACDLMEGACPAGKKAAAKAKKEADAKK